jgi:hypothetical protein
VPGSSRGEVAGYYVQKRENVTPLSNEQIYAKLQGLIDAGHLSLPGSGGPIQ